MPNACWLAHSPADSHRCNEFFPAQRRLRKTGIEAQFATAQTFSLTLTGYGPDPGRTSSRSCLTPASFVDAAKYLPAQFRMIAPNAR